MSATPPPEGKQPEPGDQTDPQQPSQNDAPDQHAPNPAAGQVGTDGQPLQPGGTAQYGQPAQPYGQAAPQFGPDGQPLQPGAYQGAPQVGADGQPLQPGYQGAPQVGADGQPPQPSYQAPQFGPDGQPLQPGTFPPGAPQFGPDSQPLQPGTYPPGAPQFGPDGQPLQPGAYPPAAGGFMPVPPEPAKKNSVGKRILFGIIAVVVAIAVSIAIRSGIFDSPKMKAGDCVQREGEDSVKVVTCGTPDAQYTVLGVVEKQSRYSGQAGACNPYPDTSTIYWEGPNNNTGTIYCLKKL